MLVPEQIEQSVRSRFPNAVQRSSEAGAIVTLHISPGYIVEVCEHLRDDSTLCFDYLMSLTAVDWTHKFEVVYHLYSIARKHHVVLRVAIDRNSPSLPSTTGVWRAADWQEREVYDMFGIVFEGHADLRRILTVEGFEGYPLRKDYVQK